MLKITLHDSARELRFKLEGKLSGPWVGELHQSWHTAESTTQDRRTIVDLGEVDFIDPDGQALLRKMHREGVLIVAVTPFIRAIVEEIGCPSCYDTVEEKPARRHDALARHDTAGRDPSPV